MGQPATRRGAIVEAMICVAGRQGYLATSVADVIAEAGASRATFYKYFEDKEDCFLAAFDLARERILAEARSGSRGRHSWLGRARQALAAVLELLAAEPQLARVAVLEVAAAGAEARRRQYEAIGQLARMLDACAEPPSGAKLPPNTAVMAVSAVVGLLLDELRETGGADRPTLLPELEFALLVPFIGPRSAVAIYAASGAAASA